MFLQYTKYRDIDVRLVLVYTYNIIPCPKVMLHLSIIMLEGEANLFLTVQLIFGSTLMFQLI